MLYIKDAMKTRYACNKKKSKNIIKQNEKV